MIGRPIFTGFDSFFEASIFGIIFGWPKRHDNGVCGTHIDSQVFDLSRAYADSSVTRTLAFSTLRRRSKPRSAASAVGCAWAGTIVASVKRAIFPTARCAFTCASRYGASSAAGAAR